MWLDELLSDSDSPLRGKFLRRASSDPVTLLDGLAELPVLNTLKDDETSDSKETCVGLESACMYGPNSPRSKEKLSFPDNVISALSNYSFQSPLQYADGNYFATGVPQYDTVQGACGSPAEVNLDIKLGKRNCGQRSRVRKIQYIAELEKTVHVFQNLETELAVRVASLLHQRASLSLENRELKQQLARLQQEKLIVDGQYQSLRKEVERLKLGLSYSPDSKISKYYRSNSKSDAVSPEAAWQMLDMRKLDIN